MSWFIALRESMKKQVLDVHKLVNQFTNFKKKVIKGFKWVSKDVHAIWSGFKANAC